MNSERRDEGPRERRSSPETRLLEDTWNRKVDPNKRLADGRAYGRGFWTGYLSAAGCALIWVVLDLLTTGRL